MKGELFMNRKIVVSFFVLMLSVLLSTSLIDAQIPSSGKPVVLDKERYVFEKGKDISFSFIVPAEWTVDESGEAGAPLFLYGPKDGNFTININATIQQVGSMPFKDYVVQAFSTRPDVVKDMTIVSEDNLVIDDHQAYQAVIDYTFNIDGKTLSTRTMQTLMIDRGYGYIFTGSATKDTFGKYKQIFKDFTDSIKFK